ncbi:uncharacterized protein LOC130867536 isoform X1 [Chionomys nivalis]|uniref:uncharacterized protein LOC130867536 isoform X1 n=1 Tax=Chionomys nivalis TaxID=269649 RepID=UPI002592289A|nr:uncharacterized protein LOC130867536 isoform X1 [Chionomys nivalis]XP_057615562.1 uncharacterized protein LOC130867536 isoform X1 [Chionomys nivalis]
MSGWIEAFPASRETADVVAWVLLDHVIPWFGIPRTIQMDNVPAFSSRVVELVSEALNISWKFHTPYHPQSSGKMEKANGLIKQQLTKLSIELSCQAPGTSMVVPSLQAQAGHFVCPAVRTFHPLVFQDATMKGLSVLMLTHSSLVIQTRQVILRSWNPLPPLRVSTGHTQIPSSQHKGHLLPGVTSWAWTLPLD